MREKLKKYLPEGLYYALNGQQMEKALEIRLRAGRNAVLRYPDGYEEIDYPVTAVVLKETLELLCGYSLYAYASDIARGFITAGGLRVGIGGRVVFSDGESRGIRTVSSLNIRLSRPVNGCADKLLPYILNNGRVRNTMLVSPPLCGKTTLLRDIVRQLSDSGINTAVIDERSEIACLDADGNTGHDVGRCSDVLSGCGKAVGVTMALRSLAPELIALDEIGEKADIQAVNNAVTGGSAVICTVHSDDLETLCKRKYILPLIEDRLFERIVFLRGKGVIANIYDAEREKIC